MMQAQWTREGPNTWTAVPILEDHPLLIPKAYVVQATPEAPVKLPDCIVMHGFVVQIIMAAPNTGQLDPWRIYVFDCVESAPILRYCEEIICSLLLESSSAWRFN